MSSGTSVVESLWPIPQNPAKSPALAACLSLVVPGLGQLYLGQVFKAVWVFTGSAALCFGFGLCNLLAALDAHGVARRIQEQETPRGYTTPWLALPAWVMRWIRSKLRFGWPQ